MASGNIPRLGSNRSQKLNDLTFLGQKAYSTRLAIATSIVRQTTPGARPAAVDGRGGGGIDVGVGRVQSERRHKVRKGKVEDGVRHVPARVGGRGQESDGRERGQEEEDILASSTCRRMHSTFFDS